MGAVVTKNKRKKYREKASENHNDKDEKKRMRFLKTSRDCCLPKGSVPLRIIN